MKKNPQPSRRIGKSHVVRKSILNNRRDNDTNNENKQLTQCVFLGVLRLKPVPSVFPRSSAAAGSTNTISSRLRKHRNNNINNNNVKESNKNISLDLNKVISGKVTKKNRERVRACIKKNPHPLLGSKVLKICLKMNKTVGLIQSTQNTEDMINVTDMPFRSHYGTTQPVFNPVDNLFNKLKQQLNYTDLSHSVGTTRKQVSTDNQTLSNSEDIIWISESGSFEQDVGAPKHVRSSPRHTKLNITPPTVDVDGHKTYRSRKGDPDISKQTLEIDDQDSSNDMNKSDSKPKEKLKPRRNRLIPAEIPLKYVNAPRLLRSELSQKEIESRAKAQEKPRQLKNYALTRTQSDKNIPSKLHQEYSFKKQKSHETVFITEEIKRSKRNFNNNQKPSDVIVTSTDSKTKRKPSNDDNQKFVNDRWEITSSTSETDNQEKAASPVEKPVSLKLTLTKTSKNNPKEKKDAQTEDVVFIKETRHVTAPADKQEAPPRVLRSDLSQKTTVSSKNIVNIEDDKNDIIIIEDSDSAPKMLQSDITQDKDCLEELTLKPHNIMASEVNLNVNSNWQVQDELKKQTEEERKLNVNNNNPQSRSASPSKAKNINFDEIIVLTDKKTRKAREVTTKQTYCDSKQTVKQLPSEESEKKVVVLIHDEPKSKCSPPPVNKTDTSLKSNSGISDTSRKADLAQEETSSSSVVNQSECSEVLSATVQPERITLSSEVVCDTPVSSESSASSRSLRSQYKSEIDGASSTDQTKQDKDATSISSLDTSATPKKSSQAGMSNPGSEKKTKTESDQGDISCKNKNEKTGPNPTASEVPVMRSLRSQQQEKPPTDPPLASQLPKGQTKSDAVPSRSLRGSQKDNISSATVDTKKIEAKPVFDNVELQKIATARVLRSEARIAGIGDQKTDVTVFQGNAKIPSTAPEVLSEKSIRKGKVVKQYLKKQLVKKRFVKSNAVAAEDVIQKNTTKKVTQKDSSVSPGLVNVKKPQKKSKKSVLKKQSDKKSQSVKRKEFIPLALKRLIVEGRGAVDKIKRESNTVQEVNKGNIKSKVDKIVDKSIGPNTKKKQVKQKLFTRVRKVIVKNAKDVTRINKNSGKAPIKSGKNENGTTGGKKQKNVVKAEKFEKESNKKKFLTKKQTGKITLNKSNKNKKSDTRNSVSNIGKKKKTLRCMKETSNQKNEKVEKKKSTNGQNNSRKRLFGKAEKKTEANQVKRQQTRTVSKSKNKKKMSTTHSQTDAVKSHQELETVSVKTRKRRLEEKSTETETPQDGAKVKTSKSDKKKVTMRSEATQTCEDEIELLVPEHNTLDKQSTTNSNFPVLTNDSATDTNAVDVEEKRVADNNNEAPTEPMTVISQCNSRKVLSLDVQQHIILSGSNTPTDPQPYEKSKSQSEESAPRSSMEVIAAAVRTSSTLKDLDLQKTDISVFDFNESDLEINTPPVPIQNVRKEKHIPVEDSQSVTYTILENVQDITKIVQNKTTSTPKVSKDPTKSKVSKMYCTIPSEERIKKRLESAEKLQRKIEQELRESKNRITVKKLSEIGCKSDPSSPSTPTPFKDNLDDPTKTHWSPESPNTSETTPKKSPMKQLTILDMFTKMKQKQHRQLVKAMIFQEPNKTNQPEVAPAPAPQEPAKDLVFETLQRSFPKQQESPNMPPPKFEHPKQPAGEDDESDCESRIEWVPEEYAEYKFKYTAKKVMSYKPIFKCKVCLLMFPSYYKLNKHKQIHMQSDNPYKCQQCEESFTNVEDLAAHIRIHKGKRPYACKKCDNEFWTKKEYEEHASVHQLKKTKQHEKKFRCNVCSKEFSKLSDIERHTRVHTGEKPCICNICNKAFQQSHNLSKHLLIHLDVRPFHCEICNKSFGRVDVLERHMLTHSVEKPVKCPYCQKGFIRQLQLTNHLKKRHPEHVEGGSDGKEAAAPVQSSTDSQGSG